MVTANTEFQFKNQYGTKTNTTGPIRWIFSHVLHYKFLMSLSLLFGLLSAIFSSIIPTLIGYIANLLLEPQSFNLNLLIIYSVLILIFGFIGPIMDLGVQGTTEIVANRIDRDTRDEMYQSMLGKSMRFHDQQAIGDLMERAAQDVRQLYFMVNPGFSLVFQSIVGIIIPIIFIYSINPQLAIIPILFVIAYIILLKKYNKDLEYASWLQRNSASRISSRLNEVISGMHVVRGASQENQERKTFNENIEEYKKHTVRIGELQARYYPLLLLGLATTLALFQGVFLLQNKTINIGQLIAFLGLLQLLRFPTFINIFALVVLSMGGAASRRLLDLINQETPIDLNLSGHKGNIKGEIIFDNVSFGYKPGNPVLQNISFTGAPGQTIALVGMTGSGKTTITKLLSRLYDPEIGKITIDGIDLRDWNLESLRSQIGLVEQDIFLFSKPIKENILLGNTSATDDAVIKACKLAKAHDFIVKLPDGYDTVIGERGITLSGGQRQRLAIARAILKDPAILILDDATSSIDSKTEDEINTAIKNVLQGRVSFLITHRISQIRRADEIILIDKGKIIGIGNHETLLLDNEKYQSIFSTFDDFDLKTAIKIPNIVHKEVI